MFYCMLRKKRSNLVKLDNKKGNMSLGILVFFFKCGIIPLMEASAIQPNLWKFINCLHKMK